MDEPKSKEELANATESIMEHIHTTLKNRRKDRRELLKRQYEQYKITRRAWYQRNKETVRAKQKVYRDTHEELILAYRKDPKYLVQRKKWFKKHVKETKVYQRAYYLDKIKPKRDAIRRLMALIGLDWIDSVTR